MINNVKDLGDIAESAADFLAEGASSAVDGTAGLAADLATATAALSAIPGVSAPGVLGRALGLLRRHPKVVVAALLAGAFLSWRRSTDSDGG